MAKKPPHPLRDSEIARFERNLANWLKCEKGTADYSRWQGMLESQVATLQIVGVLTQQGAIKLNVRMWEARKAHDLEQAAANDDGLHPGGESPAPEPGSMAVSVTHKLIAMPADQLLEAARDDVRRDQLVTLRSLDERAEIVQVATSSESRVRITRSGDFFSKVCATANLQPGDELSVAVGDAKVTMAVVSTTSLLKPA